MGRIIFLIVLFFPLVGMAAAPAWKIVPNESTIMFTATQNGAPVTGQFKSFSGDIQFDPTQLNTSSVNIAIDMSSVSTAYGEVANTLKTPDWFDIKLFPNAVFKAKAFTKKGENTYQANGTLTLRDKTVPVVLTFSLQEFSKTKAIAKGETMLKRTAFGVGQGDWANTKEIKDNVQVSFILTAAMAGQF